MDLSQVQSSGDDAHISCRLFQPFEVEGEEAEEPKGLREISLQSFGPSVVTLQHALKFVRRARDYMRAYKDGAKGLEVEVVKKVHKTHHRCVPLTLITRSALNLVQTFALFYMLDIPRSVFVIEGVFPCILHHYKFFFG